MFVPHVHVKRGFARVNSATDTASHLNLDMVALNVTDQLGRGFHAIVAVGALPLAMTVAVCGGNHPRLDHQVVVIIVVLACEHT